MNSKINLIGTIVVFTIPIYILWPATYLFMIGHHRAAFHLSLAGTLIHASFYVLLIMYTIRERLEHVVSSLVEFDPRLTSHKVIAATLTLMPFYTFGPAIVLFHLEIARPAWYLFGCASVIIFLHYIYANFEVWWTKFIRR